MYFILYVGSSVLNKLPPFRFVTANMTGQALWQTFVNSEDGEETEAPREAIVDSLVRRGHVSWSILMQTMYCLQLVVNTLSFLRFKNSKILPV